MLKKTDTSVQVPSSPPYQRIVAALNKQIISCSIGELFGRVRFSAKEMLENAEPICKDRYSKAVLRSASEAVEKWKRLPEWVRVEEKPDSFERQLKKAMPKSMERGQMKPYGKPESKT
jgi:hypothetical protein